MAGVSEQAAKRSFRSDIQGLRAIAVGAVVLYHAGVSFLPGGYVGVDVFFVISGFLITSHLLTGLRRDGKIPFASFYARRARRILPASFLVVALSVVAALIWYPPLLMREVWQGAVSTALYVPNYLFAVEGTDYLAEATPSLFQHYWSLGIEEQFYLVWPALLVLVFFAVKGARSLFVVVAAVVVLSFAACVWLTFESQPWAFFSLPTRAWELGMGGLVAFLLSFRPEPLRGGVASVAGWVGVAGVTASVLFFTSETPFPGYWAAVPVVSTALVIVAGAAAPRLGPTTALSIRPMVFIGGISYSLYLVHWPALLVPQAAVGFQRPLPLWADLTIAALCVPVAWLMYRFVEEPGRKSRWLASARPRRTLFGAAAGSALLVVLATGANGISASTPLYVSSEAEATVISNPPLATTFVPKNLRPSLRAAAGDQPVVYDDGCHLDQGTTEGPDCIYGDPGDPRIVLFGDSHGAQWFSALYGYAMSEGYSLESHTKSSCPSIDLPSTLDGVPYTSCFRWRDAIIERLNGDPPALVVISNRGGSAGLLADGSERNTVWADALDATLERIQAPTVLIADTPDLGDTPSVCLSANLTTADVCGESREVAIGRTMNHVERQVARERGVKVIDLTDYLCSDWCSPILGDTLVYRDGNHITGTFSSELAGVLGDAIEPLAVRATAHAESQ